MAIALKETISYDAVGIGVLHENSAILHAIRFILIEGVVFNDEGIRLSPIALKSIEFKSFISSNVQRTKERCETLCWV